MRSLNGLRVVEMAGIGPAPFCATLLADLGVEVIRIDRTARGDLGLDLKQPQAVAAVKRLISQADVLIEGFRPGTMERLGLGPDDCFGINSKLIYGRMTGFDQEGPEASRFSRSIRSIPRATPRIGANADQILNEWGFDPQEIAALRKGGILPWPQYRREVAA